MGPSIISRVLLYVGDPRVKREGDGLTELVAPSGGCSLLLDHASKGHRVGQACIKLIFEVEDIEEFKSVSLKKGLKFGVTHRANRYEFANARDPAKNPIQISSRAFCINESSPD